MKFSLFRRTSHKTFSHIPIYYDEVDETRKDRERKAQIDLGKGDKKTTDYHVTMKGSMRKYDHQHQSAAHFTSSQKKQSNLRIVIILAILFLMAYLLWNYTDTIFEVFLKG